MSVVPIAAPAVSAAMFMASCLMFLRIPKFDIKPFTVAAFIYIVY